MKIYGRRYAVFTFGKLPPHRSGCCADEPSTILPMLLRQTPLVAPSRSLQRRLKLTQISKICLHPVVIPWGIKGGRGPLCPAGKGSPEGEPPRGRGFPLWRRFCLLLSLLTKVGRSRRSETPAPAAPAGAELLAPAGAKLLLSPAPQGRIPKMLGRIPLHQRN